MLQFPNHFLDEAAMFVYLTEHKAMVYHLLALLDISPVLFLSWVSVSGTDSYYKSRYFEVRLVSAWYNTWFWYSLLPIVYTPLHCIASVVLIYCHVFDTSKDWASSAAQLIITTIQSVDFVLLFGLWKSVKRRCSWLLCSAMLASF